MQLVYTTSCTELSRDVTIQAAGELRVKQEDNPKMSKSRVSSWYGLRQSPRSSDYILPAFDGWLKPRGPTPRNFNAQEHRRLSEETERSSGR